MIIDIQYVRTPNEKVMGEGWRMIRHPELSHFCYLLRSSRSASSQATYIGYTNDPYHRLRMHNGEVANGAKKTRKYQPWRHLLIVGGFPNHSVALQFEWQWQNPHQSRLLHDSVYQDRANGHKSLKIKRSGFKNQLKILKELLKASHWKRVKLHIYIVDPSIEIFVREMLTELMLGATAGGNINISAISTEDVRTLPLVISTQIIRPSEWIEAFLSRPDKLCSVCKLPFEDAQRLWQCTDLRCRSIQHIVCTARIDMLNQRPLNSLIPLMGICSECNTSTAWSEIVRNRSQSWLVIQRLLSEDPSHVSDYCEVLQESCVGSESQAESESDFDDVMESDETDQDHVDKEGQNDTLTNVNERSTRSKT